MCFFVGNVEEVEIIEIGRYREIGDYSFLQKYSIMKLQRSIPLFFQKEGAKPLNTKSTCSY